MRRLDMTIQECYENIGANYDEILGRIGKAERIEKFLKLFLKDDSYPGLCKAMEEKDYKQAFACAHNLKGGVSESVFGTACDRGK